MKCPYCGFKDSKVIDSRPSEDSSSIKRRRECPECGNRFTTFETIEFSPLLVIKRDGRLETFERKKLLDGISKACQKRPVNAAVISAVVDDIESTLRTSGEKEIASEKLGDMVLERLIRLDQVAYVRFASVYRHFNDLETFYRELNALSQGSKSTKGD